MSEIHDAIENGDFGRVKSLLASQPSCRDSLDGLGNMPLHVAAYTGEEEIATLLIDLGADVNARGDFGRTALHFAAKEQQPAIVELLILRGATLAPVDEHGITPLLYAVSGIIDLSDSEGARVLLRHHAPIDLKSAVWICDADQLEQRLSAEPDGIKKSIQPEQLVPQAVIKGDVQSIEVLLRHGAPVNGTPRARPLSLAVSKPEILRKLLEAGADVTLTDSSGDTVLQNAKRKGAPSEVVSLLRQFGAAESCK